MTLFEAIRQLKKGQAIEERTWQQAVAAAFESALRSLPIDWQAEADRKERK